MQSSKDNIHIQYRPDIDGLRAIAVLLVVGFHAFPEFIQGGYIGVDIFFVISGFLITTIISKNLRNETFTIKDFYARRILRIFPALLLILIFCWVAGWFLLLPDEYSRLSVQILAGTAFFSNILFWIQGGYFDLASISKPLLHLWSLGIEEQFYIFYPLLLYVAWRRSYNILRILFVLILIFLSLNLYFVNSNEIIVKIGSIDFIVSNTFYSPFTRFWELMVGGVLALNNHPRIIANKFSQSTYHISSFSNAQSLLGVTLVVSFLAFYPYNNSESQAGAWMLLPVIGAYLLISAGPDSWFNKKVLSSRLFVWLGKISYPLYLWHWPLLSFIFITDSRNESWQLKFAIVIISILLGWITFQFLEVPLRKIKSSKKKIVALCTGMAIIAIISLITIRMNGIPNRTDEIYNTGVFVEKAHISPDETASANAKAFKGLPHLSRAMNINDPTIALVGDSHAQHLFAGLNVHYKSTTENLFQFDACTPMNVNLVESDKIFDCSENAEEVFGYISKSKTIHTVILSWYGQMMFSGGRYNQKTYRSVRFKDNPILRNNEEIYIEGLKRTIEYLEQAGKKVILVLDNPDLGFNPLNDLRPVSFFYSDSDKKGVLGVIDYEKYTKEYKSKIKNLLSGYPKVKLFDPSEFLCDSIYCYGIKDGKLLYFDPDHLTYDGSIFLGRYFPY